MILRKQLQTEEEIETHMVYLQQVEIESYVVYFKK